MAQRLVFKNCQLDLGGHALCRDGETFTIEPTDYRVLLQLVSNAPNCVSTQNLLESSWPNTVVGDNSLHQVIRRLRVVLGDDARNPKFIQTLSKVGYRFIAPIEEADYLGSNHDWESNPILVAPFHHYSMDQPDPFVADGLLFELNQQLVRAHIEVISQESTTRLFMNGQLDPQLAASLGARLVLAGTIVQQNKVIRVNAWLSDVKANRLLWSDSYNIGQESLFDAQLFVAEQITQCVINQWKSNLVARGEAPLPQQQPERSLHIQIPKSQNNTA